MKAYILKEVINDKPILLGIFGSRDEAKKNMDRTDSIIREIEIGDSLIEALLDKMLDSRLWEPKVEYEVVAKDKEPFLRSLE